MGTLWLGGAAGLIARNFTQITGADTGFPEGWGWRHSQAPPLGHCPHDVIRPPENWKTPPLLDIHKPPPLDIVCVTSSALRKIEKHPPSHHCCSPKKGPPLPKKLSCPKAGGAAAPPAHTPMRIPHYGGYFGETFLYNVVPGRFLCTMCKRTLSASSQAHIQTPSFQSHLHVLWQGAPFNIMQYCSCCVTSHICAKGLLQVTAMSFVSVFILSVWYISPHTDALTQLQWTIWTQAYTNEIVGLYIYCDHIYGILDLVIYCYRSFRLPYCTSTENRFRRSSLSEKAILNTLDLYITVT